MDGEVQIKNKMDKIKQSTDPNATPKKKQHKRNNKKIKSQNQGLVNMIERGRGRGKKIQKETREKKEEGI